MNLSKMVCSALFGAALLAPAGVSAAWNSDPAVRNSIAPGSSQWIYEPHSCSDGNGGIVTVWLEDRSHINRISVYAQHTNGKGKNLWNSDGLVVFQSPTVVVGSEPINADAVNVVPDGAGGVIVVYTAFISGGADKLFAQRIDKDGNLLWGAGKALTTLADSRLRATEDSAQPGVSPDGAGGAFVTWQAYQSPGVIYAQHIDGNGVTAWGGGNGVALPMIGGRNGYYSTIVNTGGGTAVVAYNNGAYQLYAQRINANGALMWAGAGAQLSQFASDRPVQLGFDAKKGAVMATYLAGTKEGDTGDVYAQRLDLNGNALWPAGGVNVSNTPGTLDLDPRVLVDAKSNVFLSYISAGKTLVQRLKLGNGKPLWGAAGVATWPQAGTQTSPLLVSDGASGLISMSQVTYSAGTQWYAQRYDVNGAPLWAGNGFLVSTQNVNLNHTAPSLVPVKGQKAIAAWQTLDFRLYATQIAD